MNNLNELLVSTSNLEEQVAELIKEQPISDEVKQKLADMIKEYGDIRFRHGMGLVTEITQLFGRRSEEL